MRGPLSAFVVVALLGCSSGSFEVASPAEDAAADSSPADSSPGDSSPGDSSPADSSPVDTAPPDGAPGKCGDRVPGPGEECDDGNAVDGDGCDRDCTFSCGSSIAPSKICDDAKACNGLEQCSAQHLCYSGPPKACPAPDACTSSTCVEPGTCKNKLIDGDADGQAAKSLGGCGKDCDDGDPLSFTGQPKYYVTPTKRGGFDYDCDGVETKQHDVFVKCDTSGGGCVLANEGWFYVGDPTPACGVTGDWVNECFVNGSNACTPRPAATSRRQQPCR